MIKRSEAEIKRKWQSAKPIVSICCVTYNHESYIKEALDGFLKQETTFPFEILIHDDASTDQTAEIIKAYENKFPNLIKPIYQSVNQKSKMGSGVNVKFNFSRAQGKYIALCEGDDYWTDPLKLQKQVSLMENDQEIGLVYTKAKILDTKRNRIRTDVLGSNTKKRELLVSNSIPTLTTVFRKDKFNKYRSEIEPQKKSWKMGDYPIWLWFSFNSRIYFHPEITAIYRVREESQSHSKNGEKRLEFNMNSFKIADLFASKYLDKEEYSKFLEKRYLKLYFSSLKYNSNKSAYFLKKIKQLEDKAFRTKLILFVLEILGLKKIFLFINKKIS